MRLTIERSDLLAALDAPARIATRGQQVFPILSHVRLIANGNLRIAASDLDTFVEGVATAEIAETGEACIPAASFIGLVKNLPKNGHVTLESKDRDRVLIRSGSGKYNAQTLLASDFPEMTKPDVVSFSIDGKAIAKLIGVPSAGCEDGKSRVQLSGVFLNYVNGELRGEASNGHMVIRHGVEAGIGAQSLPEHDRGLRGIIIPQRACIALGSMFPNGAEFSVSRDLLHASNGTISYTTKLVDATFPDVDRVVQHGSAMAFGFDRESIMEATERVLAFAEERGSKIKLAIAGDTLVISSIEAGSGAGQEEIEVEVSGSELSEVQVNGRYLLTVLGALEGDRCEFSAASIDRGYLIKDKSDPAALGVIMGMR